MATAKRLPSGKYRCLVYIGTENGKRKYKSFTASTKKEAEYLATQFIMEKNKKNMDSGEFMTVDEAATRYIESKKKILSQTTLKAYMSIKNNLMGEILEKRFDELTSACVQSWVGTISENHSPKTVRNAYGFFSAITDMYYPDIRFKIKLPQKEKNEIYVPTDEDIKKVIDYFQKNDKDMLIATCLAAFGTMRRSELCALTANDVKDNIITVNKALVESLDGEWIEKETKNTSSTRKIEMPKFVIEMLPKEGKLVTINPSRVSDRWIKALKRMNIKRFRFHDLRHYSASIMHAIGVPDVYIMQRGGWSSDATLKNIYRGSIDDYQRKFTDITNAHFENMQHEMQHKK